MENEGITGNVDENKGSVFHSSRRTGNVHEKQGAYRHEPGMFQKQKEFHQITNYELGIRNVKDEGRTLPAIHCVKTFFDAPMTR